MLSILVENMPTVSVVGISNTLFLGDQVIETAICNERWFILLFASCLQSIVGPFAQSISRAAFLFAMIVGRKVPLFAGPCHLVRKPLHLGVSAKCTLVALLF
jgi:hypothetical protein